MHLTGTKHYRGFLPSVEAKGKCRHRHKQTAVCFYWKIECSLNKRVNGGITRTGYRQPVDSVPLDCWDSAKAESLSLVIALFISPPTPILKRNSKQAKPSCHTQSFYYKGSTCKKTLLSISVLFNILSSYQDEGQQNSQIKHYHFFHQQTSTLLETHTVSDCDSAGFICNLSPTEA